MAIKVVILQEVESNGVGCSGVAGVESHDDVKNGCDVISDVESSNSAVEELEFWDSFFVRSIEDNIEFEQSEVDEIQVSFKDKLRKLVLKRGLCNNVVDDLLAICREELWDKDLPKKCTTLVKTPRNVDSRPMSPDKFAYFGFKKRNNSALIQCFY